MKFAILICFLIFQIQFNNGAKLPSSSLMKNSNSNEYMDRLSPTIFFSKAERSSSKEQAKQHHVDMSYSQSLIDFFETSLMKELERRQTKQHFVDKIGRQFLIHFFEAALIKELERKQRKKSGVVGNSYLVKLTFF